MSFVQVEQALKKNTDWPCTFTVEENFGQARAEMAKFLSLFTYNFFFQVE